MDDVLITESLLERQSEPDHARENRALVRLTEQMDAPGSFLQSLAEIAMNACEAESAGVSLIESGSHGDVIRWVATAGAYAASRDQTIPRDQSLCGVVISRAETMLFDRPARYFQHLDTATPPITEGLYVPLLWDGEAVGAVWVLSHHNDRQFDAEDKRVLESLAHFSSSAYRLLCQREDAPLWKNRERLRLALDTIPIGTWSFDLTTDEPDIDEGFIDLFELHSVSPESYASEIERRIPQEVLIRLYEIIAEASQSDGSRDYSIEHQAYRSDGSIMCLCTTVRVIHSRSDDQLLPELVLGTVQDITERKRFEEQLRASEERFRAMVSQAMVAVAQVDVSGNLTFVNDWFAETLGYSPAALLGRHILEFTHPEDLDDNQRLNYLVINEGVPIQSETRFIRSDGLVRWADVSASPICDVTGQVQSAVVLGTDITERKHAEEALRRSEERFRRAIGIDTVGIISLDPNGNLTWANDGFLRMSGYSREELETGSIRWEMLTPPEGSAETVGVVNQLFTEGGYEPCEKEYIRKDGSHWWGLFAATQISPTEGVGYIIDITESKWTEARLAASEERFRAMVNQTNVAIALGDLEGKITFVNDGMAAMLGYSRSELVTRYFSEITHPDDVSASRQKHHQLVTEGTPFQYEKRYIRKDGTIQWVSNSVSPVRDEAGNVRSVVALSVDISDRIHAEQGLRESEERHRALFESIDQGYFVAEVLFDENDQPEDIYYLESNPAAMRMVGQDYRGRRLKEIDPDFEDRWIEMFGHVAKTGERARMERYAAPLDTWFDFYIFKIGDADSRRIAVVFKDDTERKQEEELLRKSERQLAARVQEATAELRSLSQQLLNVQEAERRYLAHELHDEIGQALTGLTVSLEMARRTQSSEHIERASEICEYLVGQVSALTLELRPPVLDDMGLIPALLALVERYQAQTGVRVELYHEDADRRFSGEVETAAYRIVQEALTNVARHSEAEHVLVRVLAESSLQIWVIDSGIGFDVETARSQGQSLGFTGMQERASLAGGVLSIDSVPGEGTTVFAELPLEDELDGVVRP